MISTGIDALDNRLGGLAAGRYYLIGGDPGVGKTSVSLHFLGAGLEAGEVCAVLTQEDPSDLIGQAEFLGYDFRSAAEKEQLVVLQYRLDFAHNYTRISDPGKLSEELEALLGDQRPERFVIDSIAPFVDTSGAVHDMAGALVKLLESIEATTYLTVPGDPSESHFWATFDRVRTGAAGIFHIEVQSGKIREFSIRKVRQTSNSTEPFRFTIRPGLGVVGIREQVQNLEDIAPELRRRVVILNLSAELPEEVRIGLESAYDLESFDTVEGAFSELSRGQFGVLLLAVDPHTPAPAISLTRELRRAGNGVPILFYAARRNLRSSTRAKALRAGGDDFLTDDLEQQEILGRIEASRVRGYRMPAEPDGTESILLQPTDDAGRAVPVDENEVRRAVRHKVEKSSHPFFALLFLSPPPAVPEMWRILCDDLRVREGDLVGSAGSDRVVVYLHDVSRRDVRELLGRLVQMHPELALVSDVVVYSYPTDRDDVEAWLSRDTALSAAEVVQ